MHREVGAEGVGEGGFYGGHGGRFFTEEFLHRGDGAEEAAGVDQVEIRQVGGDVEGEAVEGDPAAELYAEGADF